MCRYRSLCVYIERKGGRFKICVVELDLLREEESGGKWIRVKWGEEKELSWVEFWTIWGKVRAVVGPTEWGKERDADDGPTPTRIVWGERVGFNSFYSWVHALTVAEDGEFNFSIWFISNFLFIN